MQARWLTILVTLALFGVALYGMRFVPQQFFPASDRPELLVDLKLPQNGSIYASRDVSARLDDLLKVTRTWSAGAPMWAVAQSLPAARPAAPNDFFSQAVIVTKGLEQRERVKARLEQALATEFPSVVGRVYPLELGPPVGWPLQYRVSGPDATQVRDIAFKVAQVLASDAFVEKVNYDWIEPARTLQIRVDQDEARLLGLSSQDLAQALSTVVSGATVTQIRDDIYLIDVVTRAEPSSACRWRRFAPSRCRSEQAHGSADPVCLGRLWAGVPPRVAQGPVAHADGPGRVAPGSLPATVVQRARAEDQRAECEACRTAIGWSWAARRRKAPRRNSVLVVVPVMLVLMLTILMIQLRASAACSWC